jgi:hypothetical protein
VSTAGPSWRDPARLPSPPPTAARKGFGLKALLALLVLGFCAAVSVWQYVDAHRLPGDAVVQRATVTGTDRGSGGSGGGGIATFSLPDGQEGSVYLDARFTTPHPGDEIDVYRADGQWRSPDERSTSGLVFGAAGVLLFALLVLAWWRGRRAATRDRDRRAVPLPPTHQG